MRIQKEFRDRTGLIVDHPKPGCGNSNDGNTARRFFANPEISADITKVDLTLIKKLHTILIVVSSGQNINIEKFRSFAHETAKYFVEKYPWYCMPPTLHKFLIHGPEIIENAICQLGNCLRKLKKLEIKILKTTESTFRANVVRKINRGYIQ